MPRQTTITPVDPVTLNALTDLYYCFKNMAIQASVGNESIESFDRFFISQLQYKIEEYYHASHLDPVKLGEPRDQVTLKELLPVKAFSQISPDILESIKFHAGSLKHYNDYHGGVGKPVPEDVHLILNTAQNLMSARESKQRSTAVFSMPNLAYATVLYENNAIHIDNVIINLDSNSIMNHVARYMFTKTVREQVDEERLLGALQTEAIVSADNINSRAVKTACSELNKKVKKMTHTELDLFDTSINNKVIRMY
jgi:hypothetical protein